MNNLLYKKEPPRTQVILLSDIAIVTKLTFDPQLPLLQNSCIC